MKTLIFALNSLLATTVLAQAHRHQQLHSKRESALVVVTDWVTVTETVVVVDTFTVTPGYVAPTTLLEVTSTSSSTTSSPSPSSTSSTSSQGGQFFQGQSSSTTTTTIRIAHATSSSVTEPSTPPAPTPTSSTSVYVPPASTPAAPQATTSPSTPSESGSGSGSQSGGSMSGCTPGTPCTGDITWYKTGMGSCGVYSEDTESVVALSVDLMAPHDGQNPNHNPYCGQMITIKLPSGATTTAKVVDTCNGCSVDSIDLSSAAFTSLTPLTVGRTPASWWFN